MVQGYASVRRQALDQILIEAAADAGAEVRQGFTVEDLMYDGEQDVGVRGRTAQTRPAQPPVAAMALPYSRPRIINVTLGMRAPSRWHATRNSGAGASPKVSGAVVVPRNRPGRTCAPRAVVEGVRVVTDGQGHRADP